MPVRYSNRDIQDFRLAVKAMPQTMRAEGKIIVAETIKEGADVMYQLTNRIDTETMKATISYSSVESNQKAVSGSWGWGIDGAELHDYYHYQEDGTRYITPMHALLGSYVKMREKFLKRVERLAQKGSAK